mgnify:CR=1 FL=1
MNKYIDGLLVSGYTFDLSMSYDNGFVQALNTGELERLDIQVYNNRINNILIYLFGLSELSGFTLNDITNTSSINDPVNCPLTIEYSDSFIVEDCTCEILNTDIYQLHYLNVIGGTGIGYYYEGEEIKIIADEPSVGLMFDTWTGNISIIQDRYSSTTIVNMDSNDNTIIPTYKQIPTTTAYVPTTTVYVPTTTSYVPTTTLVSNCFPCTNNELILSTVTSTEYSDWNNIDIRIAQSITLNGLINKVQVIEGHRQGLPNYNIVLKIYDGLVSGTSYPPTNTLLGTSNLVYAGDTIYGSQDFCFSTPISVNGVVSLVFDVLNVVTHDNSNRYYIHGDINGTYSSGQTYYQYGGSWTAYGNSDLAFNICYLNLPTTAYVPTTTSYVPTTTAYVPTTTAYVPTTTAYVPTTTVYSPTTTSAIGSRLMLTWDNIANVPVADVNIISLWNNLFNLPTNGNPFTSVTISGNTTILNGGSNISLVSGIFSTNTHLISIYDNENVVVSIGEGAMQACDNLLSVTLNYTTAAGVNAFAQCALLNSVNLPLLQTADTSCFEDCWQLANINLPQLISAGDYCFYHGEVSTTYNLPLLETAGEYCFSFRTINSSFNLPSLTSIGYFSLAAAGNTITEIDFSSLISLGATVGDNNVFLSISGNNIVLTVPAALMTCNGGNPDGDIQYLVANNTVTVIQV